jgi:hypothetical protein
VTIALLLSAFGSVLVECPYQHGLLALSWWHAPGGMDLVAWPRWYGSRGMALVAWPKSFSRPQNDLVFFSFQYSLDNEAERQKLELRAQRVQAQMLSNFFAKNLRLEIIS